MTFHPNRHDLTGRTFGDLTVLAASENRAQKTAWLCRCACGKEKVILACNLASGKSLSCGACVGFFEHRKEYGIWSSMLDRCRNPRHRFFHHYGGRGISVCDRWRESFRHFFADMGPKPAGTTLDRINNDGNYEPSNCRWATHIQQHNNTRSNRRLTIDGRTQTMAEWARELGLNYRTVKSRLNIAKKTPREALGL